MHWRARFVTLNGTEPVQSPPPVPPGADYQRAPRERWTALPVNWLEFVWLRCAPSAGGALTLTAASPCVFSG